MSNVETWNRINNYYTLEVILSDLIFLSSPHNCISGSNQMMHFTMTTLDLYSSVGKHEQPHLPPLLSEERIFAYGITVTTVIARLYVLKAKYGTDEYKHR